MLTPDGQVKILDLGWRCFCRNRPPRKSELTNPGEVMGTWDYMAPSRAATATRWTSCADIYSLGCTLFKMLTGSIPFATSSHGRGQGAGPPSRPGAERDPLTPRGAGRPRSRCGTNAGQGAGGSVSNADRSRRSACSLRNARSRCRIRFGRFVNPSCRCRQSGAPRPRLRPLLAGSAVAVAFLLAWAAFMLWGNHDPGPRVLVPKVGTC